MEIIDLRSDTVTRPSRAMRQAMMAAEVGDDVYGEDPTVNRLEEMAAELFGMDRALFTCSGTLGNLVALLAHCERGDEYIVGQQAHTYRWEGGGAAVFGSIQPQPLEFENDGTLSLDKVREAIKPDDYHYARTRLLCLENTQGGKVLPLEYLEQTADMTAKYGLGLHLDGARLFNASVKLNVAVSEITRRFDTVSVCLSKGLGAPAGSLVCGSRELIAKARRWRKVAGGGMRQAGILAAAGIFALEHNIGRLADDHDNAQKLAAGLASIDCLAVEPKQVQTNMVFARVPADLFEPLREHLKQHGILIGNSNPLRLVTHLDITAGDVAVAIDRFKSFFVKAPS